MHLEILDTAGNKHVLTFDDKSLKALRSRLAQPDEWRRVIGVGRPKGGTHSSNVTAHVSLSNVDPEWREAQGYGSNGSIKLHRLILDLSPHHAKTGGSRRPRNGNWLDFRLENWPGKEHYYETSKRPDAPEKAAPAEQEIVHRPAVHATYEVTRADGTSVLFDEEEDAMRAYSEEFLVYVNKRYPH